LNMAPLPGEIWMRVFTFFVGESAAKTLVSCRATSHQWICLLDSPGAKPLWCKIVPYPSMRICQRNHVLSAQWLAAATNMTAVDVRADDNFALRTACWGGYLEVAQWLVAEFGLTAEDARAHNNTALHWSCSNGHLEVAQWLTAKFGLTAKDVRAGHSYALRSACSNGHLAVAQWLVATFDLTAEDARFRGSGPVRQSGLSKRRRGGLRPVGFDDLFPRK
jgi:ankyrin repeat protein